MSEADCAAARLWVAMEARDWGAVEALLAPDFVAEWPQSNETFDRAMFLRVNQAYPGDWHLRVLKVVSVGDEAVTEIEVRIDGRVERAVSFFELRGGAIVRLREYWPEPFPVPEWRKALVQES